MLPAHLIARICSCIPPSSPLASLMTVNKTWYKGCIMYIYESLYLTSEAHLYSITSSSLSYVSIGWERKEDFSYVRSISVQPGGASKDELMIGDLVLLISLTPKLRKLIIRDSMVMSNIVMRGLSEHATGLRYLDLKGCLCISNTAIPLLISKCLSLEHLDVSYTSITPSGVALLLPDAPKLRRLMMNGCTYRTIGTRSSIGPSNNPQKRSMLEFLSCLDSELTDDYVRYAATVCPQLSSVNFSGCHVSDEAVLSLARHCPLLEHIDISFSPFVTDVGLHALAAFARRLRTVISAGCENLSPAGIAAICSKCDELKEVVLHGCHAVLNSYIADWADEKQCVLLAGGIKAIARSHASVCNSGNTKRLVSKRAQTATVKSTFKVDKKEKDLLVFEDDEQDLKIVMNHISRSTSELAPAALVKLAVSGQALPPVPRVTTPPATPRIKNLLDFDEIDDTVKGGSSLIPVANSTPSSPPVMISRTSHLPHPKSAPHRGNKTTSVIASNGEFDGRFSPMNGRPSAKHGIPASSSILSSSRSSIPRLSPEPNHLAVEPKALREVLEPIRSSSVNGASTHEDEIEPALRLDPRSRNNANYNARDRKHSSWDVLPNHSLGSLLTPHKNQNGYKPRAGRMKIVGDNDVTRLVPPNCEEKGDWNHESMRIDKKKVVTVTASTAGYHASPSSKSGNGGAPPTTSSRASPQLYSPRICPARHVDTASTLSDAGLAMKMPTSVVSSLAHTTGFLPPSFSNRRNVKF
ncbi:hypothetical protein SeMB42_g01470 [Synchytrium endobioticum]|uniref:F-box domain-containing protein n=1 Tax=Synchytrium endobioticum TaxID=286115 RepID=A0A507DLR4_9FUNG|nr:hypothetical protein SeLEV6574_g01202 [Synchytrium endobioticum]TPX52361.1 hypothetical protein SeMB42_g01470 [Synchytrium endobioticum]